MIMQFLWRAGDKDDKFRRKKVMNMKHKRKERERQRDTNPKGVSSSCKKHITELNRTERMKSREWSQLGTIKRKDVRDEQAIKTCQPESKLGENCELRN